MPSRSSSVRSVGVALARSALLATLVVAASACQARPRTAAEPAATSLVVRNPSRFEVNVYAVPATGVAGVWLGTIGAASSKSLAVPTRGLRDDNTLVVQARAVGASSVWTSQAVPVENGLVSVLDLAVDAAGNCVGSALRAFLTADYEEVIR